MDLFSRATVLSPPTNGIVGGYTGDNIHIQRLMVAFSAIAWYNCGELIFLTLFRFKKWQGLYFWSLMVTSWAIVVYQIGSFGKMNNICRDPIVMTVFTNVGWLFMIGGNSLVLYSRLHLLTQNRILLRFVLWGVIINTICMYIPTTILDVGTNITHVDNPAYVRGYGIMERVQMTLFTIQELIISTIYLLEAWRFLKDVYHGDRTIRRIMWELVAVNVALIVLDIALLTVAQRNMFAVEVTFKGFVYSVKLKLELGVLSRLVKIVTSATGRRTATIDKECQDLSAHSQVYTGHDFHTSPFQEKSKISYETNSAATSPDSSQERTGLQQRPKHSIPWLSSNVPTLHENRPAERFHTRLHRAMSAQAVGPLHTRFHRRHARQESFAVSPTDKSHPDPVVHAQQYLPQTQQHVLQRGESYANSEFLTSAAVTEGANDENIRQFNREIEAELSGAGESPEQLERAIDRRHSHVNSSSEKSFLDADGNEVFEPPQRTMTETAERYERAQSMAASERLRGRLRLGSLDSAADDGELEWQRKLGVLGGRLQNCGLVDSSPVSPTTSRNGGVGAGFGGGGSSSSTLTNQGQGGGSRSSGEREKRDFGASNHLKSPSREDKDRQGSLEDLYPGRITGDRRV